MNEKDSPIRDPVRRGSYEAKVPVFQRKVEPRGEHTSQVWSRCCMFATTTCFSTLVTEVILEGATVYRRQSDLPGPAVALILTCGEFAGCSVLAYLCGGRLLDERQASPGTSRKAMLLDAVANPFQALQNFLSFWLPYMWLAILLFCGTGLANMAIQWVQFPVKVIIKSSKLVPAMLVSGLLGNSRSYKGSEYFAALALCVGIAVFSMHPGQGGAPPHLVVLGIVLLLVAILGDVTALNTQQWMMQRRRVPPMSLMLRQNVTSLVLTMCLLFTTDDVGVIKTMLWHNPKVFLLACAVGMLTSVSVWANTNLVNEAGSVTQVAISTGRKGITVMLSYILFPKPFTRSHFLAIFLVLTGLMLRSRASGTPPSSQKSSPRRRPGRGFRRTPVTTPSGLTTSASRDLEAAVAQMREAPV